MICAGVSSPASSSFLMVWSRLFAMRSSRAVRLPSSAVVGGDLQLVVEAVAALSALLDLAQRDLADALAGNHRHEPLGRLVVAVRVEGDADAREAVEHFLALVERLAAGDLVRELLVLKHRLHRAPLHVGAVEHGDAAAVGVDARPCGLGRVVGLGARRRRQQQLDRLAAVLGRVDLAVDARPLLGWMSALAASRMFFVER